MQGILLQIRYFEIEFIKSFKKVNFYFEPQVIGRYITRISFVCHSYVLGCYSYVTYKFRNYNFIDWNAVQF